MNSVILIYFIHPLLVGVLTAWLGDEAISSKMIAALAAAFVGLGLAVGFTVHRLNTEGLLLAALATITCVGVIIGNGRAVKQANGLVVVFYMMLSAAAVLAILFAFFGSWALPSSASGWLGFAGVAIGSTIGTLTFFCAVPILGAVRATMVSNLEPLLGILFAVLILEESIAFIQGAGIAIVLAAIVTMEWSRAQSAVQTSERDTTPEQCPSSYDLRLLSGLLNGGSGSSWFEVRRPAADAASVFGGWSGA